MDPYQILKDDHRRVESLFKKIEQTSDAESEKRQQLFDQLKKELETHTKTEEKTLYSDLKEREKTHDRTMEAIEEHHVVDILLQELSKEKMDSHNWLPKLQVLKEMVKHHVEEEERGLFPEAHKTLDPREEKHLGREIEHQKQELKAS